MLNEASLTDVMEPVGAIFLSRTALKEKLFHSGGLMQNYNCQVFTRFFEGEKELVRRDLFLENGRKKGSK